MTQTNDKQTRKTINTAKDTIKEPIGLLSTDEVKKESEQYVDLFINDEDDEDDEDDNDKELTNQSVDLITNQPVGLIKNNLKNNKLINNSKNLIKKEEGQREIAVVQENIEEEVLEQVNLINKVEIVKSNLIEKVQIIAPNLKPNKKIRYEIYESVAIRESNIFGIRKDCDLYYFKNPETAKLYEEICQSSDEKLQNYFKECDKEGRSPWSMAQLYKAKEFHQFNGQIFKGYKDKEKQNFNLDGFRVIRRDRFHKKTSFNENAKYIDIETKNFNNEINRNNRLRIELPNGTKLELGLDKQDCLDPENIIPLTAEGAKQPFFHSPESKNYKFIEKNIDDVIKTLSSMKEINLNGKNIIPDIMKAMELRKGISKDKENNKEKEKNGMVENLSQIHENQTKSSQANNLQNTSKKNQNALLISI